MSLLILFDGAAAASGAPTITSVSDPIVPRRGGKVVKILGTGFEAGAVVELLQASVVQGAGYIFDADFDVTATCIFVGLPPLPDGVYDLQITVGAATATFIAAFEYRLFAEETKVMRVRGSFAQPWRTGPRILTNNIAGLAL